MQIQMKQKIVVRSTEYRRNFKGLTVFYITYFSEAKALFRQKLTRKWGHC